MAEVTRSDPDDRVEAPAPHFRMTWRRLLFAGLVGGTWSAAVAAMSLLLAADGLAWSEGAMLLCFALSIPMVVIGFWNSALGAAVMLASRDYLDAVAPFHRRISRRSESRVAIAMPVYNEDTERVFRHLQGALYSSDAVCATGRYEIFLLSDSTDPEVRAEELRRFRAWKQSDPHPERLHYRHRDENAGFKAGNLWDFVQSYGDGFDYMVVLDADSAMHGRTVDRLVRMMDANPRIGILQSLAVGLPTDSAFARIFQFGMRHGMLVHTVGAAWWQGDTSAYWGHNAVIRMSPFKAHCGLKSLPGKPPLGGHVLSHDQVEAALMRAGGYEVRVLPVEGGSYEEMPPTLPDFIKRDLRWCQGNMQYLKLIGQPGFTRLGRVNLTLAVLMYTGAPAWLAFMLIGLGQAVFGTAGPRATTDAVLWGTPGLSVAIAIFVTMMGITFAPKLIGYAHALASGTRRRAYGGGVGLLGGAVSELVVSTLIAPVVMLTQSVFVVGLFLGRTVTWEPQVRDGHQVAWRDAAKRFWPHTLLGLVAGATLGWCVPTLLPWAAPVLLGLLLAVPVTVLTGHPLVGQALARVGLCAIPEERKAGRFGTRARTTPLGHGGGAPGFPAEARGSQVD